MIKARTFASWVPLVFVMAACSSALTGADDSSNGGGGAMHCAQSSAGCRCSASSFGLLSDERPVASCDGGSSSAKTPYVCCFDLDSNGETTECECEAFVCTKQEHSCTCHWTSQTGSEEIAASECTDSHAGPNTYIYKGFCCDTGSACDCYQRDSAIESSGCGRGDQKTTCSGTGTKRDCRVFGSNALSGHEPASSCNGLKWKKK